MKRYRLKDAERPEIKAMTEELALCVKDRINENTIWALADVFLQTAGPARDAGLVGNDTLTKIRAEIGAQLSPKRQRPAFSKLETELLLILAQYNKSVSADHLARTHHLSRQSVNTRLHSLTEKGAVTRELRGTTGFYALAPGMECGTSSTIDAAPKQQ